MKLISIGNAKVWSVVLCISAACAATAQPQPQDTRPQDNRPQERRPRPDRPLPPGDRAGGERRFEGMGQNAGPGFMRLFGVLTPEQRQSMREVTQENREKNRQTEEKLLAARKAMMDASLEGKFDERAIRKHAKEIAEIEADRMVAMARALSKIEPPLTEDQKRQLREPAPMGPGEFRGDGERFRYRDRNAGPAPERERPPRPRDGQDRNP